ncbi:ABC transporter ATP-binding protein [Rhodoligotrophos defluvii]|uniref:ABC transporter ATP-binding protein n=1 Tax=Rhodoligotrophos defluvii TaxID=2561934 RepID=UPI00196000DB|nr:ABC transporter ATP-binding protein [Rhodoligotrophos defluvii]
MPDAIISIRNLTKAFPGVIAVDNVSLDIRPNEFFALLGPSGCGKTTLLRMIAGFEVPTSGEILLDGQDVAHTPPNERPVNMVFQSYAVFPHMTVAENVAYGLKVSGVPRAEIGPRVEEALATAQLSGLAHRKPDQLSGGQRQRVALARALIKRPKVLLLDEPLSALDAKLREQMRLELTRLQHSVGITFIIVTHDQDEALSMANRIAVMNAGRVAQVATPLELYENPASRFVADFIGKVNLFEGRVLAQDETGLTVRAGGLGTIRVPQTGIAAQDVSVMVRPEKLALSRAEPAGGDIIVRGRVRDIAYFGDFSHVFVATDSGLEITADIRNDARRTEMSLSTGEEVWVSWRPEDTLVLQG